MTTQKQPTQKHTALAAAALVVALGGIPGHTVLFVSSALAAGPMMFSTDADMNKLIGTNIKNTAGDTVGEVKSVHVDAKGKISNVIVGVGGFLGVGDREVALKWSDLSVTDDGKKVTTSLSKETLKALPEYKYKQATWRGTVFRD